MTENLRKLTECQIMITYNSVTIIENNFCSDASCLIPLVGNSQPTLFISSLSKLSFIIKTNSFQNSIHQLIILELDFYFKEKISSNRNCYQFDN